jgi:hypothetical protein
MLSTKMRLFYAVLMSFNLFTTACTKLTPVSLDKDKHLEKDKQLNSGTLNTVSALKGDISDADLVRQAFESITSEENSANTNTDLTAADTFAKLTSLTKTSPKVSDDSRFANIVDALNECDIDLNIDLDTNAITYSTASPCGILISTTISGLALSSPSDSSSAPSAQTEEPAPAIKITAHTEIVIADEELLGLLNFGKATIDRSFELPNTDTAADVAETDNIKIDLKLTMSATVELKNGKTLTLTSNYAGSVNINIIKMTSTLNLSGILNINNKSLNLDFTAVINAETGNTVSRETKINNIVIAEDALPEGLFLENDLQVFSVLNSSNSSDGGMSNQ